MSRCEISGKRPTVKNLVSHSNIKTKSRALINTQLKRFFSPTLKEFVRLRVATSTIRDMEHRGGFDPYLLAQPEEVLSNRAKSTRTRILRKLRGSTSKAASPSN